MPPTEVPSGKNKGTVFEDLNGNGTQEDGEPGIKDVSVVVTDSTGVSQTVVTDSSGKYPLVALFSRHHSLIQYMTVVDVIMISYLLVETPCQQAIGHSHRCLNDFNSYS